MKRMTVLGSLPLAIVLTFSSLSCRHSTSPETNGDATFWVSYDNVYYGTFFIKDNGTDNLQLRLADSASYINRYLTWSPNHKLICLYRDKVSDWSWELGVIELSTRTAKTLYSFYPNDWITPSVSWSYDSHYISFRDANNKWRVMSIDGATNVDVCPTGVYISGSPSWSPTENTLAFFFVYPSLDSFATCTYSPVTGNTKVISDTLINGNWSPDGTKLLLFGPPRHLSDTLTWTSNIYEYDLPSGKCRQLTFDNHCWSPYFSPDGRKIVYVSGPANDANRQTLYILDIESGNSQLLARSNGEGWHIMSDYSWSPDGSRLIFSEADSLEQDAFIVNSDGTNLHLLKRGAISPQWGPRINDFTPF